MDIGVHLPSAQSGASAEGIMQVAQGAEDQGFDTLWFFDHLFTPSDLDSKYPYTRDGDYPMSAQDPFFDPIGLYGVLSGATKKVKLATGVLIPAYRNPIVLGKILATVENFAPGRVILGVGAGWMVEEFEAVGVGFERRGARLNEYIKAVRAVWSGEANSFDGEFYSWIEAGFLPAPTAPIPIIVGGHSDAALKRAARLGDGWAAVTGKGQGSGLDAVDVRLKVLDGFLADAGRTRDGYLVSYQHVLWFSDEPNPKMPFTGPPDAIAGSLKRAQEIGITHVDLVVFGPAPMIAETVQRFAEEVKPLL